MTIRKGFKLSSTVNALVLLTVIVTLAVSAFIGYRNEKQTLTNTTMQLNRTYTDKISDATNGLFAILKQNLKVTGQYLAQDLNRADLHEQLVMLQQSQNSFNSVFIIDKDGVVLEGSTVTAKDKGKKSTSEGTQLAIKERRSLVTEPYYTPTTNKLIITISEPLFDRSGVYLGFIGGSIRLHETNLFQKLLGESPVQQNGSYPYVVSSSGTLLYHPDPEKIGEKVSANPVVAHLMNKESGMERITNLSGFKMLASFAYIEEAGWGIVMQTPVAFVVESARTLVFHMLMYVVPLILVFMAAIYWFVRKWTAPLAGLAEFATMLSPSQPNKDALPQIHCWSFEANELHKAFGRAVRHFRYQFESLSQEAQTDPLTGLVNRRTLDFYMRNWISQNVSFSMLVLDLDNFKQVNDTFGHDVGDEVLKFMAGALKRLTGPEYVCCRFGGEEFVVLVPDDKLETAQADAETIRKWMAGNDSPTGGIVTLSVGVAHYPVSAHNAEQLFRYADEALYRAKRLGRNRVEVAHAEEFNEQTS